MESGYAAVEGRPGMAHHRREVVFVAYIHGVNRTVMCVRTLVLVGLTHGVSCAVVCVFSPIQQTCVCVLQYLPPGLS